MRKLTFGASFTVFIDELMFFHCHQISTNHVLIQSAQDILCTDLAENITINQISILFELKRDVKSCLIFQIILVNNFSECQL